MSIDCSLIESVAKDRVHCPTCLRDYRIFMIKHVCNPLLPCSKKVRPKYEERYLQRREEDKPSSLSASLQPEGFDVEIIHQAVHECDECETKRKKLTEPRKGTCPECEYSGWYVYDETKLCPVCKNQKLERERVASELLAKSARQKQEAELFKYVAPKEQLDLYLRVDNSDLPPHLCRPSYFMVHGYTQKSIYQKNPIDWVVKEWEDAFHHPQTKMLTQDELTQLRTEFYTKSMQSLSDFLKEIQETYEFRWQIAPSSPAKLWLLHLYDNYGPEDKIPLRLEW